MGKNRGASGFNFGSPLLFVLYVNDLPKVVTKCTVTLYADDITVVVVHKSSNAVTGYLNEDQTRINLAVSHG